MTDAELTALLAAGICASGRVEFSLERHQELIVDSAIAIMSLLDKKLITTEDQPAAGTGKSATE